MIVGAHFADRFAPRSAAEDRWTRHIDIDLPVDDPDRWTPGAREIVSNLLEVSTGDRWTLGFHRARRDEPFANPPYDQDEAVTGAAEVALFSGGLDSTAHAAQLATAGTDALLVTFTRPRLSPIQDTVFSAIEKLEGPGRLRRIDPIPMDPRTGLHAVAGGAAARMLEKSSRSRSLFFATKAVYVAAAYGAQKAAAPENGQLAINPSLSLARWSSCSTGPAHPWALHQLDALVGELGGGVEVVNPLVSMTKGDVCVLGLCAGLSPEVLFSTISCGKPPFFHDVHKAEHCGLCVACLMRRSGLLVALGRDATEYQEPVPASASRLRGLFRRTGTMVREPVRDIGPHR